MYQWVELLVDELKRKKKDELQLRDGCIEVPMRWGNKASHANSSCCCALECCETRCSHALKLFSVNKGIA
jgi:hypothetical protein